MKKILIVLVGLFITSCSTTKSLTRTDKLDIIQAGLEELDLDVKVHLAKLKNKGSNTVPNSGFIVRGRVGGGNGEYIMQLSDEMVTLTTYFTIAHELIHVQQLELGQLRVISMKTVLYKGREYNYWQRVPHERRRWERDAEVQGRILAHKLRAKFKQ